MGGGDLLVELANGAFPVVLLTAYGSERTAVESIKAGAMDYMVKSPEMFADMPHLVRRTLKEWRQLQERRHAEERLEKVNRGLLELGPDFAENVRHLAAVAGELLAARTTVYNRIEGEDFVCVGGWRVPDNYPPRQLIRGSLCDEVLTAGHGESYFIAPFQQSPHAGAPFAGPLGIQACFGPAGKLRPQGHGLFVRLF